MRKPALPQRSWSRRFLSARSASRRSLRGSASPRPGTQRPSPGGVLASLIVLGAVLLLPDRQAHAYLDPGTGSLLVQGLIGAVAAGLLVLKLYWQKLRGLFSSQSASEPPRTAPEPRERPSEPTR